MPFNGTPPSQDWPGSSTSQSQILRSSGEVYSRTDVEDDDEPLLSEGEEDSEMASATFYPIDLSGSSNTPTASRILTFKIKLRESLALTGEGSFNRATRRN